MTVAMHQDWLTERQIGKPPAQWIGIAGAKRRGLCSKNLTEMTCTQVNVYSSIKRPPEPGHSDRHRDQHEADQRGRVDLQIRK